MNKDNNHNDMHFKGFYHSKAHYSVVVVVVIVMI